MIPRLPKGFTHPMSIGEGSFSSVYRARQQVLDRWVAIKVLHEKDPQARRKLLDEARTQASLSMPGIPAIYDVFSRGPRVFLVMEWIKGVSLQALLARGLPRPADRAALAASLAAALAEIHRRGFAHRDLKPANILITPSLSACLVDFGFARRIGEGAMSIAGVVKGTPAYMAPEIWRGDPGADLMRADLYSLGRIFAELDPGPPWKDLGSSLLSQDPSGRPASAAALWEAWSALPPASPSPGLEEALRSVAAENLSRLLLKAARELLLARRRDEAYWLLAECLQEDPEYAEAVKLMEDFPQPSKGLLRNRKAWYAGAAAAALAALAAGFFAGREAERKERVRIASPAGAERPLLLPDGSGRPGAVGGRFVERRDSTGRLAGFVFAVNSGKAGECDSVRVDGKVLAAAALAAGLPLKPGEHEIACADAPRAERITLLPFQRRVLRLRAAAGNAAPGAAAEDAG